MFYFFLKTFNLNDRGNKPALSSVSKVNTFSTESLMPRALVEIGIKKWTTVFETPAGSERAHVKHSKTQKQQVSLEIRLLITMLMFSLLLINKRLLFLTW